MDHAYVHGIFIGKDADSYAICSILKEIHENINKTDHNLTLKNGIIKIKVKRAHS